MRWGYLIPRVTIVFAVWMFFTFVFDSILGRAFIASGQTVTGAKIDLDRVHTTFFPPTLSIEHAQIASKDDPWKNLFQFDDLRFRLSGPPLLRKSFIVEEASLRGLRWNTPRESSGELPDAPKSDGKAGKYAKLVGDKVTEIGKNWTRDFRERMRMEFDPKQLESIKLADTLQASWSKRFKDYEQRVKDIETRLKQVEMSVKNAKGNAFDRFKAYRAATAEADKLFTEAQRIRNELNQLPKTAGNDFRRIDDARLKDRQTIKQKLDLFKPNADNLSQTLLGPTLKTQADDAIEWAHWIKDAVAKATAGAAKPERMRGINVMFPRPQRLPGFLIQKLAVSGVATFRDEQMPFAGTITDITSDPKLHGKPIRINLSGKASSELHVVGIADYTRKTPRHHVTVTMVTPSRKEIRLGENEEHGVIVTADRTEWRGIIQLQGDALTGSVRLLQSPVSFRSAAVPTGKPTDEVARVLESALADIRQLEATVVISGTLEKPKWTLQTDLGRRIAEGVNRAVSREIRAKQLAFSKRLDDTVNSKTLALEKSMNVRFGSILSQLKLQETGTKKLIQRVAGNRKPSLDYKRLFRR